MLFTRKFDFEKKTGTNVSKTDERELKEAFTYLDQVYTYISYFVYS
jgi:hypothetical protein